MQLEAIDAFVTEWWSPDLSKYAVVVREEDGFYLCICETAVTDVRGGFRSSDILRCLEIPPREAEDGFTDCCWCDGHLLVEYDGRVEVYAESDGWDCVLSGARDVLGSVSGSDFEPMFIDDATSLVICHQTRERGWAWGGEVPCIASSGASPFYAIYPITADVKVAVTSEEMHELEGEGEYKLELCLHIGTRDLRMSLGTFYYDRQYRDCIVDANRVRWLRDGSGVCYTNYCSCMVCVKFW